MIDLAGGTAADKRQVAGGRADALLGYRPLPGIADEMIDPQGKVRPVWQHLLGYLGRQDEQSIADRFATADRYLSDAGVFYRAMAGRGHRNATGRCRIFR